jgi:hypothetical protein
LVLILIQTQDLFMLQILEIVAFRFSNLSVNRLMERTQKTPR